MWEIYIMFYKTLEMQSQTTSNHSPLPQEICAPVVESHGHKWLLFVFQI